ncbi:hypothetical protein PFICI_14423 [Pestalotiopsis fici W106-1]|uniref:Uncharacterized protein n=1 Tax=Pestalotiopsis fici (strain W106-1 / CGMCC3.15140) TaxID=1229662 RepID=W3WJZ6_PESFW|nr:uncharacterized protein PFICI_14423 [Pestalotiopsis fici W106-1]ETS73477.1 hypothetical protein PFICI_14423 [Pestalotiopsis fici W106-1]
MKSTRCLIVSGCAYSTANLIRAPTPLATLTLTIPTQGTAFTTTVSGCEADNTNVDPFAVVAIPNGTFYPGTQTYYVPPQASAQSSTFVNYQLNATEVIIITPLEGTCAPFLPPETASGSEPASEPTGQPESGNPDACPLEGCSKLVNQGARKIIDALNQVTILSQSLQAAAKQIGLKRDNKLVARYPLGDLLRGLRNVPTLLTSIIPYVQNTPAIPPGCDSDTVVVALIDFVRVHQALLQILIGRSSLLSSGSSFSGLGGKAEVDNLQEEFKEYNQLQGSEKYPNPFGAIIAGLLRGIESVVDNIAFGLIGLIPTRDACLRQQKLSIDGTLNDAIEAYSS